MKIGILGGMGPLATADLLKKLTLKTPAEKDQDHLRVIIDSNAQIPDRTAFILGGGTDPVPQMKESIDLLEHAQVDLIMMPCNTAHYFHPVLSDYSGVEILHMVKLTADHVKEQYDDKRVYLLATKGTYQTGIYQDHNPDILVPDDDGKDLLMDIIYSVKGNEIQTAAKKMDQLIQELSGDAFILGCTELSALISESPMPNIVTIDPMDVMVDHVINKKAALR